MGVFVIAEAGVNHNGDKSLALALIDAAVEAGADAVKFQTFNADTLATARAPKAAYQMQATNNGETQLEMLRRLEISHDLHAALAERAAEKLIRFLSTPFDAESLRFLTEKMKLDTLKIASGEITNGPLLLAAGRNEREIILSTGMSTLEEIEDALAVLAFAMTGSGKPCRDAFRAAFAAEDGKAALRDRVTLLQCTSQYPTPVEDANLNAMATLGDTFGLRVGLSDHTEGIAVAIAAAALGAVVIEKHFTLDRDLPGPDHRMSLTPEALSDLVAGIRAVEKALGSGDKAPNAGEERNRVIVRKSLVAVQPIKAGEPFTEDNLGAKRPGDGITPMSYWDLLGRTAERDFAEDETVS